MGAKAGLNTKIRARYALMLAERSSLFKKGTGKRMQKPAYSAQRFPPKQTPVQPTQHP